MELPGRSQGEEDAFVSRLLEAPPEALVRAIDAAMAAKRPQLAARLVALLPEVVAEGTSATRDARKAAQWLLVDGKEPEGEEWSVLEDAWAELRRRRMRRHKHRTRRSLDPMGRDPGRR